MPNTISHHSQRTRDVATNADPSLTRFLTNRDEPCPGCGYNLRALTGSACPECGQQLRLGLALAHPRLAWYVAGIVGLAFPSGFYSIMLAIGVIELVSKEDPGIRSVAFVYLVIAAPMSLLLVWFWVTMRRRLQTTRALVRWIGAVGCWVGVLLHLLTMYVVLELIVPV